MTPKAPYETVLNLLRERKGSSDIISNFLDSYNETNYKFHTFKRPSLGTTKSHILGVYQIRESLEKYRIDDNRLIGYSTLLKNLKETRHEHICISTIMSKKGTLIIFSDFDKSDLIGVLFSKLILA